MLSGFIEFFRLTFWFLGFCLGFLAFVFILGLLGGALS